MLKWKVINLIDHIRLHLNLLLIYLCGSISLNKNYCYLNNKFNNDSKNLILHNKLSKTIKIVKILFTDHYYICNNNLIRKIFELSPHYFGPGIGKEYFFNC